MIVVAGGILLAVFVLLVLFGFALVVRDVLRWCRRSINPVAIGAFIFAAWALWRVARTFT